MKGSTIEWTDHTVNFWWGCTMATLSDGSLSEECRHCYAMGMAKRFHGSKATWGRNGLRWDRSERAVEELLKLDAAAGKRGVRERVFINSMSDTFEDRPGLLEAPRELFFLAAEQVRHLDLQVLTKRPGNLCRMVPAQWLKDWPAHVWLGTTCGTQQAADERVPQLLRVPAKVRFLSCEPLLGAVDLQAATFFGPGIPGRHWPVAGIHWVICGGESGSGARAMRAEWSLALRDQCQAAQVPFFFKQWGEFDAEGKRVGKKAAGRLLEGRTWDEFPASVAVMERRAA